VDDLIKMTILDGGYSNQRLGNLSTRQFRLCLILMRAFLRIEACLGIFALYVTLHVQCVPYDDLLVQCLAYEDINQTIR